MKPHNLNVFADQTQPHGNRKRFLVSWCRVHPVHLVIHMMQKNEVDLTRPSSSIALWFMSDAHMWNLQRVNGLIAESAPPTEYSLARPPASDTSEPLVASSECVCACVSQWVTSYKQEEKYYI